VDNRLQIARQNAMNKPKSKAVTCAVCSNIFEISRMSRSLTCSESCRIEYYSIWRKQYYKNHREEMNEKTRRRHQEISELRKNFPELREKEKMKRLHQRNIVLAVRKLGLIDSIRKPEIKKVQHKRQRPQLFASKAEYQKYYREKRKRNQKYWEREKLAKRQDHNIVKVVTKLGWIK
jgi:hypothetical protein